MSISEGEALDTDFDRWLAAEFARAGHFTVFAVLVRIAANDVAPLCSTYLNVIGDEIDWGEITTLFAGAGQEWDGAAFFSQGRVLDNPNARLGLRELEDRLDGNPLVLNEGEFFDKWGRRLRVDEVNIQ